MMDLLRLIINFGYIECKIQNLLIWVSYTPNAYKKNSLFVVAYSCCKKTIACKWIEPLFQHGDCKCKLRWQFTLVPPNTTLYIHLSTIDFCLVFLLLGFYFSAVSGLYWDLCNCRLSLKPGFFFSLLFFPTFFFLHFLKVFA